MLLGKGRKKIKNVQNGLGGVVWGGVKKSAAKGFSNDFFSSVRHLFLFRVSYPISAGSMNMSMLLATQASQYYFAF